MLSVCVELVTELTFFWFSRGNLIQNMSATATKPYLKETRNLNDKAVVLELMKNFANFLINMGYPEQVTPKELQKIDKQNFVKYFNVINFLISFFLVFNLYIFFSSSYFSTSIRISNCNPVSMRMNWSNTLRILDIVAHWPNRLWFQVFILNSIYIYFETYLWTIFITVGALHSTSQIYGLFSWLTDFVGMFNLEAPNDEESIEKVVTTFSIYFRLASGSLHSWIFFSDRAGHLLGWIRSLVYESNCGFNWTVPSSLQ